MFKKDKYDNLPEDIFCVNRLKNELNDTSGDHKINKKKKDISEILEAIEKNEDYFKKEYPKHIKKIEEEKIKAKNELTRLLNS